MRRGTEALAGFDDPTLEAIQAQARAAEVARRTTFVARLPLPPGQGVGDVTLWSAALQQLGTLRWTLDQFTVCPEAEGPVAYAVLKRG